jgi:hypothetical protein
MATMTVIVKVEVIMKTICMCQCYKGRFQSQCGIEPNYTAPDHHIIMPCSPNCQHGFFLTQEMTDWFAAVLMALKQEKDHKKLKAWRESVYKNIMIKSLDHPPPLSDNATTEQKEAWERKKYTVCGKIYKAVLFNFTCNVVPYCVICMIMCDRGF